MYDSGNVSKPFLFTYEPHLRFRKRFKAFHFTYEPIYGSENDSNPFHFTMNHIYDSGNDSKLFHFMNDTYDSGNVSKRISLYLRTDLRFRKRFKAISLFVPTIYDSGND
ncbi:hypothetical protein L596_015018 [Steinernema carpocapsae]|uniref:Uncharacterized protein n=1 Tax=Steinernema carpocapsae TaxID=34508 RepID=A0A4U5NEL0_STECR|nr:hypothetical protein L596_015018 [Steinernema carpocapsae]